MPYFFPKQEVHGLTGDDTMIRTLRNYYYDCSGAVTVDWVVLTAAVVGLAIAAAVSIAEGTILIGDNVGTFLDTEGSFIQNE